MSAQEVREQLLAIFQDLADGGFRVVGYADDVKPEPDSPLVVLWVASFGPVEVMSSAALLYRCKVLVAVSRVEPGNADNQLDGCADTVRHYLDRADQLLWTLCTRGTYLETFPAYTFDVEMRA